MGNTDDNLLDPSNWTAGNGKLQETRTFGANIYATGAGFFKIDPATGEASLLATGTPVFLSADNGNTLICGNGTAIHIVDNSENLTTITQKNSFKYLSLASGTYWASCGYAGLRPYRAGQAGNLEEAGGAIAINSPYTQLLRFHAHFSLPRTAYS